MARLSRDFFARDTLAVARDLLGRLLVRELDGERLSGRIVEVEAYIGEEDQASHARVGRTARNAAMYGPPGHAYVYLIYGMHYCLNLVTGDEGFPAAVLVRALQPLEGIERMRAHRHSQSDHHLTDGPAGSARRWPSTAASTGRTSARAAERALSGSRLPGRR
jgi:DNA-3-methyladenine glycosylase